MFKAGDKIRAVKDDLANGYNVGDEFIVFGSSGGVYFTDKEGDHRPLSVLSHAFELSGAAALLRECAALFREYESAHLAKGTPEGVEKAFRNYRMAVKIEAFLETNND